MYLNESIYKKDCLNNMFIIMKKSKLILGLIVLLFFVFSFANSQNLKLKDATIKINGVNFSVYNVEATGNSQLLLKGEAVLNVKGEGHIWNVNDNCLVADDASTVKIMGPAGGERTMTGVTEFAKFVIDGPTSIIANSKITASEFDVVGAQFTYFNAKSGLVINNSAADAIKNMSESDNKRIIGSLERKMLTATEYYFPLGDLTSKFPITLSSSNIGDNYIAAEASSVSSDELIEESARPYSSKFPEDTKISKYAFDKSLKHRWSLSTTVSDALVTAKIPLRSEFGLQSGEKYGILIKDDATTNYDIIDGDELSTSNSAFFTGNNLFLSSRKTLSLGRADNSSLIAVPEENFTASKNTQGLNDGKIEFKYSGGYATPEYQVISVKNIWNTAPADNTQPIVVSDLKDGAYNLLMKNKGAPDHSALKYPFVISPIGVSIELHIDEVKMVTCKGKQDGIIYVTYSGVNSAQNPIIFKCKSLDNGNTYELTNKTGEFGPLAPGKYKISAYREKESVLITYYPKDIVVEEPEDNLLLNTDIQNAIGNTSSGVIVASAVGGVKPYKFKVNTSGSSSAYVESGIFSNLEPSLYEVSVKDDNGCEVSKNNIFILNSDSEDLVAFVDDSKAKESCFDTKDGVFKITFQGGTPPYVVKVDDRETVYEGFDTHTESALSPGVYNYSIVDKSSTKIDGSVTVEAGAIIEFNHTIDNITCSEFNSGRIEINNTTGGIGDYVYEIEGQNVENMLGIFSNMEAGEYIIKVSNNDESRTCSTSERVEILKEDSNLSLTLNGVQGSPLGEITMNPSDGYAPYQFELSPNFGKKDLTANRYYDLPPGVNYTVKVTDAKGCVESEQYQLAGSPIGDFIAILTYDRNQAVCNNIFAGSIYIDVYYAITDGDVDITFNKTVEHLTESTPVRHGEATRYHYSGFGAGSYIATVNVQGQSPISLAFTIEPVNNFEIKIDFSKDLVCHYDENSGHVKVSAIGGKSPLVFRDELFTVGERGDFKGLTSGKHKFTIEDSDGCTVESEEITLNKPGPRADATIYHDDNGLKSDGDVYVCPDNDSIGLFIESDLNAIKDITWKRSDFVYLRGKNLLNIKAISGDYFVRVTDTVDCIYDSKSIKNVRSYETPKVIASMFLPISKGEVKKINIAPHGSYIYLSATKDEDSDVDVNLFGSKKNTIIYKKGIPFEDSLYHITEDNQVIEFYYKDENSCVGSSNYTVTKGVELERDENSNQNVLAIASEWVLRAPANDSDSYSPELSVISDDIKLKVVSQKSQNTVYEDLNYNGSKYFVGANNNGKRLEPGMYTYFIEYVVKEDGKDVTKTMEGSLLLVDSD